MRRAGIVIGVAALLALGGAGASDAVARMRASAQPTDTVCASTIRAYKRYGAYPPGPHWVWTIPHGCVFLRDLTPTADCQLTPGEGCLLPPDVHIRYQRRSYVFHLTLRGLSAKAKGIWGVGGQRRFIVAHDGRAPKTRERLFVEFTGTEFDGFLASGPNKGLPDLGPALRWLIEYTIDTKRGLCCPHVDPGSPNQSPFDVTPVLGSP